MVSVFAERYAQACRRHPDLVAVHESPNGDIALVLRHTFVPLPEEHAERRPPDGALAHRLERLVPPDERARWRPWIDVVLAKLGRALERAPERRDRRWLRSLFLVAYDAPPPVGQGAILRAL